MRPGAIAAMMAHGLTGPVLRAPFSVARVPSPLPYPSPPGNTRYDVYLDGRPFLRQAPDTSLSRADAYAIAHALNEAVARGAAVPQAPEAA